MDSVRLFVEEQMGSKFITSVGFDLQEIYEESNNRKPLIFILSPGRFFEEAVSRIFSISLNSQNTVKLLLSGPPRDLSKCPLNRVCPLKRGLL